ncbi:MAG: hypothetical protein ACRD2C_16040 [Acidimicrobiales bacterium]
MGIGDRFRAAAEAARANIVNQTDRHDRPAVHGVHGVELQPEDFDVARRAMSLGAPDPFSLIPHDDVVALTGLPVGGPELTYTDDDLGVRFDAEGGPDHRWSFGVHVGHAVDEATPFDPRRWHEWMVDLLDGAEVVPLGESARYHDGLLYVFGAGRAFYVMVDAPDGSPAREWALRIGRRVLERFDAGLAG